MSATVKASQMQHELMETMNDGDDSLSALERLPVELTLRILQVCQDDDFVVTFRLARLNHYFCRLIFSNPSFWKYLDLELEFCRRDHLRDNHVDGLLKRIDQRVLPHISVVDLTANASLTYQAVVTLLQSCPNLTILDLRYCYKSMLIPFKLSRRDAKYAS